MFSPLLPYAPSTVKPSAPNAVTPPSDSIAVVFEKLPKKYKNRICGYDTVRCSNNHDGVGGRLSYFTISWKPSDLYFIGLDGFSENMKNDPPNAFRDWIKGSADSHYDHNQIKTSHSEFADYVYNFSKANNINIYNLGEGLRYNVLTEFSEKLFPLPKNIKNKLKESK